jgi:hypothetical protein
MICADAAFGPELVTTAAIGGNRSYQTSVMNHDAQRVFLVIWADGSY